MPQWDYRKINLNDTPRKTDDMDLLNNAGEDGWELVAITSHNFAYLKRQREDIARPAKTRRKAAALSSESG
jgi:hypothetical protein